jgi:Holliday junction resolvase RusA-like endonuclease
MGEDFKYRLDIEGYPCQRPRLGRYGNTHNTAKYSNYKRNLAFLIKSLNIPPNDYEYVAIKFCFSYPASTPQKKRIDLEPMRKKYDIDNLIKTFFDALQDSGVISDDRCICGVYAEKIYTNEAKGWIEFEFQ